jgi:hypothetical protein
MIQLKGGPKALSVQLGRHSAQPETCLWLASNMKVEELKLKTFEGRRGLTLGGLTTNFQWNSIWKGFALVQFVRQTGA